MTESDHELTPSQIDLAAAGAKMDQHLALTSEGVDALVSDMTRMRVEGLSRTYIIASLVTRLIDHDIPRGVALAMLGEALIRLIDGPNTEELLHE